MMSTADARTRTVGASGAGSNRDAPMTVDQAKALLRGVKRKDKDKKGEKKKHGKKEKKEKHGKKDKKHGKKQRRRDGSGSDSDSSDDSDSDDRGAGKQRRWGGNNGVGDGGGKKKMEKTQWGSTPDATVEIPTITEDDYYLKNKEFSMWLQHTHKTYFTDLLAADARVRFGEFVNVWNERGLPGTFYEDGGIDLSGRR